jgi:porphobilinogen deaminase
VYDLGQTADGTLYIAMEFIDGPSLKKVIQAGRGIPAPRTITILSSSPRRSWLLEQALPELLPWRVEACQFAPVRGNIATRLARLTEGRGDALVVAKAALDRLLGFGAPFEDAARTVRAT